MNQSETKQERLLLQEREVNLLSFNSNEELELIKKLTLEFEGDLTQLGSAIGCLFMCKTYGYKIIRLAYDAKTIAKYERFFQIVKGDFRFKNYSEEIGPLAQRSTAFRVSQNVGRFWAVVKGQVPGRGPTVDGGIDSVSNSV